MHKDWPLCSWSLLLERCSTHLKVMEQQVGTRVRGSGVLTTDKTYARDYFALGRACLSLDSTNSLVCEYRLRSSIDNISQADDV